MHSSVPANFRRWAAKALIVILECHKFWWILITTSSELWTSDQPTRQNDINLLDSGIEFQPFTGQIHDFGLMVILVMARSVENPAKFS